MRVMNVADPPDVLYTLRPGEMYGDHQASNRDCVLQFCVVFVVRAGECAAIMPFELVSCR